MDLTLSDMRRPDVFELALPLRYKDLFEIKPVVTAFGETDTDFVFYNNFMIGFLTQSSPLQPYHDYFKIKEKEHFIIYFVYGTFYRDRFPVPLFEDFLILLSDVLDKTTGWELIFEYDCEQHDIIEYYDSVLIRENIISYLKAFFGRNNFDYSNLAYVLKSPDFEPGFKKAELFD